ncbi:MAG TPA: phosphoglycerate kinase [Dehalococcoidia bacterium]
MKKTVRDVDVKGKHVLVRVDFNVPFDRSGNIADDNRIRAALPTVDYLRGQGAKVILCSHLGRPDGKVVESMRMTPVAERLKTLTSATVHTVDDCVGPQVAAAAQALQAGEILLLENLRFHAEEEKNDAEFARQLASLAEVYVNDAFGTAHRAHASTEGVTHYLPSVAGFLMTKELEELGRLMSNPARPFAAILGGAKISSKIGVLTNLLSKVDILLLGGGIATTFVKAMGSAVGQSLVEDDYLETARDILGRAEERGVPVLLPTDVVIAEEFAANAEHMTVSVGAIPANWRIMDAGHDTLSTFRDALDDCGTIFWNGTLGVAEFPAFAEGSLSLALYLADSSAAVVIGGGETAALVEQAGLRDRFSHVSTGGGASLEFLEGRTLPGVAALNDA